MACSYYRHHKVTKKMKFLNRKGSLYSLKENICHGHDENIFVHDMTNYWTGADSANLGSVASAFVPKAGTYCGQVGMGIKFNRVPLRPRIYIGGRCTNWLLSIGAVALRLFVAWPTNGHGCWKPKLGFSIIGCWTKGWLGNCWILGLIIIGCWNGMGWFSTCCL